MTRTRRVAHGGRLLALGVACLAGCQQPRSHVPPPQPLLQSSGEGRTRVTSAQAADMEIALGRAAEQQGNVEQAIAAYRQALKRDRHRADAYIRLAILHDRQGKFRESAALYREALKLAPGDAETFCDMGYSLYLQRRWAEAEMNFRQAIVLKPDRPRAHNNLALVLARDGRVDDALAEFRKGGSNKAQAHANVAFVLTLEDRWTDARQQYQLALAADPSSTEIKAQLRQLDSLVAKLSRPHQEAVSTASVAPAPPAPDGQLVATSVRQRTASTPIPLPSRPSPIARPAGDELAPALPLELENTGKTR